MEPETQAGDTDPVYETGQSNRETLLHKDVEGLII